MQPASSRSQSRSSRTHERPNAAPSSSPSPRASTSSSSRASAPPSKRARLGSRAPSRAGSVSADPLNELHSLRKDSSQRLLDSWNQLAERYARPLDQDDIIDLRTKSIVLDAGALRGTADTYDFGALTKQAETEAAEDEGEGEDFDELDLLGQEPDISGGLQGKLPNIPPVRVMDPSDAADLREFMELEQKRREQFGDVDGDDIVFTRPKLPSSDVGINSSSKSSTGASRSKPKPPRIPPSAPVEPPPDNDDSADEFSAWEPNDATYVYLDNDGESNFEDASTGLLSDDQLLPPPSSSPTPDFPPFDTPSSPLASSRPSSSASSPPPVSRSRTLTSRLVVDSDRESSPDIEIIPVRSSPVKKLVSSAILTSRAAVSLPSTKLATRPVPSKSHVLQLQTPPRSTSLTSLGTSSPFSDIVKPPSSRDIFRANRPPVRPQRPVSDGSGSESEELAILTARARRPVSQAPALNRKTPVKKTPVDTSMRSSVQSPEHLVGRNKPRRRRDHVSDARGGRTPDRDLSPARPSSPLDSRHTRRDSTLNKSISQIRSAPAKEITPALSRDTSIPHTSKGKTVARSYPSPDRRSRSDTDSPPPQRVAPRRTTGRRPASPSTSTWDESETPLSRERERTQRHPVVRKRKRVSSDEGSPVLRMESHAPRRRPILDRNDHSTSGNGRERLHRGDRRGTGHPSEDSSDLRSHGRRSSPPRPRSAMANVGQQLPAHTSAHPAPTHFPSLPLAPAAPWHDPQAQYMLAQAMHNIHYLMGMGPHSSGSPQYAMGSPVPFPSSTYQQSSSHDQYRPSYSVHAYSEPSRIRRIAHGDAYASSSSSYDAHPSSPLPPSSPPLSSPSSPPRQRSALSRGRSQSRGRRVSFHNEERHIYDAPPRRPVSDDNGHRSRSIPHAPSHRFGPASSSSVPRARSRTGQRSASPASDSDASDDPPPPRGRSKPRERGETPGPPKRH